MIRAILIAGTCAAIAFGQSSIFVTNELFSLGIPPTPSVAPGSLFSVFLESATIQDPTTVTVTITGLHCACVPQSATITGVLDGRVTAQLPPDFPVSGAEVTLGFDGQTSAPAKMNVVASNFILYPNFERAPAMGGTTSVVQLTNPMRLGDIVTFYGTGLGLAQMNEVAVFIGGHPVEVTFAGPTSDRPGVDRIDFQAPDDVAIPDGCYVAFSTVVFGGKGNETSISKAVDGGVCESPFGFSPAQLANLDAGGKEVVGEIYLSSYLAGPQFELDGSIFRDFVQEDHAGAFFTSAAAALLPMDPLVADDSYFRCKSNPLLDYGFILYPPYISVGGSIALAGPGESLMLQPTNGSYSVSIPPSTPASSLDTASPTIFNPGMWVAISSGSADVPPFQVGIQSPPAIRVTNYAQLTEISSQQSLAVTWDPTGYSTEDVVTASLFAGEANAYFAIWQVTCTARAQAGQLTIPSRLLSELADLNLPDYSFSISESIRPGKVAPFSVPLTSGDTAAIFLNYSSVESFLVVIR